MKADIKNREDISSIVRSFYERAKEDELIGKIFMQVISQEKWDEHIEVIVDFWNSILFLSNEYNGNAFPKHMNMDLEQKHFDRWLKLFYESIDAHYQGPNAGIMKNRATQIATMFMSKIKVLKGE